MIGGVCTAHPERPIARAITIGLVDWQSIPFANIFDMHSPFKYVLLIWVEHNSDARPVRLFFQDLKTNVSEIAVDLGRTGLSRVSRNLQPSA